MTVTVDAPEMPDRRVSFFHSLGSRQWLRAWSGGSGATMRTIPNCPVGEGAGFA